MNLSDLVRMQTRIDALERKVAELELILSAQTPMPAQAIRPTITLKKNVAPQA